MEKEQLTGVWTKPAKAVTRKTGEAIAVRRLGVTGWAGIVPPESGVTLHEYCPGCQFTHWSELTNANALINPDNWDGSDFFMIWPMPAYFFVSEKVRKVFADYNLKGARFSKTFPEGSGMGFSPQRLSYWMPEERAHQIGDPLGIY